MIIALGFAGLISYLVKEFQSFEDIKIKAKIAGHAEPVVRNYLPETTETLYTLYKS